MNSAHIVRKGCWRTVLWQKTCDLPRTVRHLSQTPIGCITKGNVTPRLEVPAHISVPSGVDHSASPAFENAKEQAVLKTEEDIDGVRRACKLARKVLDYAGSLVSPGVTTDAIDKAAHQEIVDAGAYPSPLGYMGFPKSLCTSVNEVIVHGIPDTRELQEGDIITIDVTVFLDGFHGDCAHTFAVGNIDPASQNLINLAKEAQCKGMEAANAGSPVRDIAKAIDNYLRGKNCHSNEYICGHGIGREFHEGPNIIHSEKSEDSGAVLQPGMVFTVEPAIVETLDTSLAMWEDKWTLLNPNGCRSAQFEHTLAIHKDGTKEVLTAHHSSH